MLASKAVKILAEPRLVTLSGFSASFCTGSVKTSKKNEDGSTTIDTQPATVIDFIPDVMGDKIHLRFSCKLAEADQSHSVIVGNETIPGIRTMEIETTTESRSGQTLAIGGLTQVLNAVSAKETTEKKAGEKIAMLLLVRPEIIRAPEEAAKPAALVPPPIGVVIRQ